MRSEHERAAAPRERAQDGRDARERDPEHRPGGPLQPEEPNAEAEDEGGAAPPDAAGGRGAFTRPRDVTLADDERARQRADGSST